MTRETEFWTITPLLAGQTLFCCASGPSFTVEVAHKLKAADARCIVVNSSCRIASAAGLDGEILYFTDSGWFKRHRDAIDAWRGMIVTGSRRAKAEMPDRVKRPQTFECSGFNVGIGTAEPKLRNGRSSGHIAIGLAGMLGAARVPLCGYDMKVAADGREHCHSDYIGLPGNRDLGIYAREFLPGFVGWDAQAKAAGFIIVNATPGSALTEFAMVDLDDELALLAGREIAA